MTRPTSHVVLAVLAALTLGTLVIPASAQEITLYSNDFESPNQPISASCGNSLDMAGINTCYGRAGYSFVEEFSVEVVVLDDPGSRYANQGKKNGRYAIGMLGEVQDDKLALRFDVQSQRFLNVAMDVSSIDVDGCGGPFGIEAPRFRVTLLDNPTGSFDWNGKKLDEKVIEGDASSDPWHFLWTRATVALDASGATDGHVIVVFDLISDGYAVFDNLVVTATRHAARADRDADGIDDAEDNCPTYENGNQANADGDKSGDACDPAPKDPTVCGDRNGDGRDDCGVTCDSQGAAGCGAAGATSGAAGRSGGRGRASRGDSHTRDDAGTEPHGDRPHDKFDSHDRREDSDGDDERRWRPPRSGGQADDHDDHDHVDCASVPSPHRSKPTAAAFLVSGALILALRVRARRRSHKVGRPITPGNRPLAG